MEMQKEARCHYNMNNDVTWSNHFTHTHTHMKSESVNDIWSACLYWTSEWHLVSMPVLTQGMTSGHHVCTESVNDIWSACLYRISEWQLVSMSAPNRLYCLLCTKSVNDSWSACLYRISEWQLVSMSAPNRLYCLLCTKSVNDSWSLCLHLTDFIVYPLSWEACCGEQECLYYIFKSSRQKVRIHS